MKFLLNENVSRAVAAALREAGHEAEMAREVLGEGVPDADILERAVREGQVVVTFDTDFGRLVYEQGKPHLGVALLRLKDQRPEKQVRVLLKAIEDGKVRSGTFAVLRD
jgi:predicted nuclease of predicted toxin-antitoxin system